MTYSKQKVTTFKERLNDICESSDKLDIDIARDLHVSKQTLSAWKIGTRSPREPMIITIAEYFHVSVDWLMGFDVPMRPDNEVFAQAIPVRNFTNEEAKSIEMFLELSYDARARIENMIRFEYEQMKKK